MINEILVLIESSTEKFKLRNSRSYNGKLREAKKIGEFELKWKQNRQDLQLNFYGFDCFGRTLVE
jgi:hypothetical protein